MKKNLLLSAIVFLTALVTANANTVNVQTAQTIATNFFKANVSGRTGTPTLSYTQTETDGTIDFYVFNMADGKGFVIVSANDNVQPVIAYSNETTFNVNGTRNGVGDWIKTTSAKIHFATTNQIPGNAKISRQWSSWLNGQNPNNSKSIAIGPLCTTTWNQEPYYNSLCPFDSAGNARAVTGCVATAMAQIMKYWNYPATGVGSTTYYDGPPVYSNSFGNLSADFTGPYNWAAMPNAVNSNTSPVDTLMYILGVSVNMDYGTDAQNGSGAFVLQSEAGGGTNPCSQYSFANYFHYNPNTLQGVRMNAYNTVDWIALMENELNNGRVIQYEGDDPTAGGHTWVCDGYETNGMLHMNWGWGGVSNGFFAVGDLSAGGYNFGQNDAALIGIEPLFPFTLNVTATSQSVCAGGNTTITANAPAGATYSWTPSTGLSCTTCASPTVTPTATTLYKVTVDSAGVQATTSFAVVITQTVTPNFSTTMLPGCTLPEKVNFIISSANGVSYLWDFGDGTTSTSAEPTHLYTTGGVYTAKLYVTNACGSDSLVKNDSVHITSGPPVIADKNVCPGNRAILNASGMGNILWFNAAAQGNELSTGTTYTTPVLNNTTTYYVSSSVTPAVEIAGPTQNTIGSGSYYTRTTKHGLVFNCTAAQKLISVDVYSDTVGKRIILLQDSAGHTLDSLNINVVVGHATITLNWQLPVRNKLYLCSQGLQHFYRNSSGVSYPYTTADGSVSITGNNTGFGTTYNYFYNWKLQQTACQSSRIPVTVFVLGTGGNSFTATGTGNPTVNFTPADNTATTYEWSFGDGATSTDMNPQHTYAANGTYTVQLVVGNGTCFDTVTQDINTISASVQELNAFSNFNLYPNPAKDQLTLNVSSNTSANNCLLNITNLLGETVYHGNTDIVAGTNNLHFNVAQFAAGIYIITLQSGNDMINTRFVKTNE